VASISDDDPPGSPSRRAQVTLPAGPPVEQNLVLRFQLQVMEGPSTGHVWESTADRCSIGSHPSNDLVIDDPTVSRFHCEIRSEVRGPRVRDLESKNGTIVDGVDVLEGYLRPGSILRLGHTSVRFDPSTQQNRMPLSSLTQFGSLVGTSLPMRTAFSLLERAAPSDATVLLEGETGTGKEGAAEAIHQASSRRDRPFLVVDCGAIPANLLESELFGHEKGSFTGAHERRIGAFEEASGGTIFLDEVGEMPPDLQPKLLRVLERREVKRVGANKPIAIDVRVIAATNRDLRADVNAGRFRADLYFRLAVVKIPLPPLRDRPEDLPYLLSALLTRLGADPMAALNLRTNDFIESLKRAAWPGNVRELRNYIERCLVFQEPLPLGDSPSTPPALSTSRPPSAIDSRISYAEARRLALADFEKQYLTDLLARHQGRVSQAARDAGIDRVYLHRLLRRHGVNR
jgi:two-component system, NtrC family, response regulator GlrR